jgi:hypothetical protein
MKITLIIERNDEKFVIKSEDYELFLEKQGALERKLNLDADHNWGVSPEEDDEFQRSIDKQFNYPTMQIDELIENAFKK